jgi:hypothetical protein
MEGIHGDPCDALQNGSVVMKVQIESGDLFGPEGGDLMTGQKVCEMDGRQGEYDLKMQRRPLSLDDAETIFPKLLPAGIFSVRLFIEKVLVQESVDGELVKGSDLAFDKCKLIEGILQKKVRHTGFGR